MLETIEGQDTSLVLDWVNHEARERPTIPVYDYNAWLVTGLDVEKIEGGWKCRGFNFAHELTVKLARRAVWWGRKHNQSEVDLAEAGLVSLRDGWHIWALVDFGTNLAYAWKIAFADPAKHTSGGVVYRPIEPYVHAAPRPIQPAREQHSAAELLAAVQAPPPMPYVDEDGRDDQAAVTYGRVDAHPLIATLDANMKLLNDGLEAVLAKLSA